MMGIEQNDTIPWGEAVNDWYQHVYLPIVQMVRKNHLPVVFPFRTEADLYLWITEHHWYQVARDETMISYEIAMTSFMNQTTNWLQRTIYRLFHSLTKKEVFSVYLRKTGRVMRLF